MIYTVEAARLAGKWLVYSGTMRPAATGSRPASGRMSLGDLGYFIRNTGFDPVYVYEAWGTGGSASCSPPG